MNELTKEQYLEYHKNLGNREWRINNLYHIVDERGKEVIYKCNPIQQKMYGGWWYWTIVLKSRKVGSTTHCIIEASDKLFFKSNYSVAFIADTREHTSNIIDRIRFAYDHMTNDFKDEVKITTDNKNGLVFSNGSSVSSTTSTMSGSPQLLVVSEYGPICQYSPDKAEEIVTGSLNSVGIGNRVIVESTIRKNYGKYAEFIQQCMERNKKGILPSKLQFHLMFFPWMDDPKCQLSTEGIEVYPRHEIYFRELEEKTHRIITPEQRAFYISKESINGPKVKSEYPSTIDECLEKVAEGTYYANEFEDMRKQNRICKVPHEPGVMVNTAWDLGLHHTCVWFYQVVGRAYHIIDYCHDHDKKLIPYFTDILESKNKNLGYRYGIHVFPHDSAKGEDLAITTRIDAMRNYFNNKRCCVICPKLRLEEGIPIVRQFLNLCWFDTDATVEGRDGLENYCMVYNSALGQYIDTPLKDGVNDDPADAFRYLATWETIMRKRGDRYVQNNNPGGGTIITSSSQQQKKVNWGPAYT